jgi:hypothetical protein
MEILSPGQVIELDREKDGEQILVLISGLRAVPMDLIPEKGQYKAVKCFSRKGQDGRDEEVKPGQILTLDHIEATKLMTQCFLVPLDVNSWRPQDLISPRGPVSDKVKKMFDDVQPAKESWVQKGVVRK